MGDERLSGRNVLVSKWILQKQSMRLWTECVWLVPEKVGISQGSKQRSLHGATREGGR
jgi:hypothetical protein